MKDFMLSVRFQTLRFLGVWGLLGLLLLAAAALIGYLLIPQINAQSTAMHQEIIAAKDSAIQASEQRRNAPNTVSQLQNFLNWLPPLATNAKDVKTLFVLAKEGGIDLTKADYQLTAEPGAQFLRYQVTVPIKDRYIVIRRFAVGALNDLPHLALDELQFSRLQASSDVVDAQLRFTFFYRPQ
ncbi:hypothetical protein [Polaromonas jejuensis]|nr:hypothetical protein [Polaromonas jejuensis]